MGLDEAASRSALQYFELVSKKRDFDFSAARDRNGPSSANQIKLQRSLIRKKFPPTCGQSSAVEFVVGPVCESVQSELPAPWLLHVWNVLSIPLGSRAPLDFGW
jgi:hypothetical protein